MTEDLSYALWMIREREKMNRQVPDLPDWLDKEAWVAWIEARKAIRKPLTERAKKMWLEDLADWHEQNYDTRWILREAAKRDWAGLFVNERTPRRLTESRPLEPLSPHLQAVRDRIFERERGWRH